MFRLTPVVKNILIINVAVFVFGLVLPKVEVQCLSEIFSMNMITRYLGMWFYKLDCFKPYQLFTYMFVHGDFMHIFFNMLMLAFIAPTMEMYWGSKRFLVFYMVTGVGAAVFTVLMNMLGYGPAAVMVGASGALYGVLMAFGMTFPNMQLMLLFPPIPIKAKYLVFVLAGISLLMGGNVAHFTHLGGIVVAYVLIQLWRKRDGGRGEQTW